MAQSLVSLPPSHFLQLLITTRLQHSQLREREGREGREGGGEGEEVCSRERGGRYLVCANEESSSARM